MGMNTKEKIALVVSWERECKVMNDSVNTISVALGLMVESPVIQAVDRILEFATSVASIAIGDNAEWLGWYANECQFGKKPKQAVVENRKIFAKDAKSIVRIIDENNAHIERMKGIL
jgi:hypothetical protein